jgi:hypothetical protein
MKVARLSALCTGRLYPQVRFLVLITVTGCVDYRAIVQLEGLSQWKISKTPAGIKPVTFTLVSQRLNKMHYYVPQSTTYDLSKFPYPYAYTYMYFTDQRQHMKH